MRRYLPERVNAGAILSNCQYYLDMRRYDSPRLASDVYDEVAKSGSLGATIYGLKARLIAICFKIVAICIQIVKIFLPRNTKFCSVCC